MRFKIKNKGFITTKFIGPPSYEQMFGHPHTGIDYSNGYGQPVYLDNKAYCYKRHNPDDNANGWAGLYFITPYKDYYIEIVMGHFSKIYMQTGKWYSDDAVAGLEGNKGKVASRGVLITKEMQDNGDKRGTHTHEQYRPVRKVNKTTNGKHYLRNKDGTPYFDKGYYEVILTNKTKGCIDPLDERFKDSAIDKIEDIMDKEKNPKTKNILKMLLAFLKSFIK